MKLTEERMLEANFARQVALDPSPVPTTGDEKADAEIAEEIKRGQVVLEEYSLRYSARFTVLVPKIDRSDVSGVVKVVSGYIATSPAYRLAIFKKRK